MRPAPEASERQRKAAYKAWETIRRNEAERSKAKGASPEIAEVTEAKGTASEILKTAEAKEATISQERDLQAALRTNIEQLEIGLVINDGGKEKVGASGGRSDILAVDAKGQTVVIELKVGTADRDAIGQILQYMGDLQEKTGAPIRGIIIAHDFTGRAIAASKPVPSIELRKYKFNFSFQKV
jgi:RecB family endonuclease NucS